MEYQGGQFQSFRIKAETHKILSGPNDNFPLVKICFEIQIVMWIVCSPPHTNPSARLKDGEDSDDHMCVSNNVIMKAGNIVYS